MNGPVGPDPTLDRTVAVLGLGLVGGSLARDLAAAGTRVVGADTDPATVRAALDAGVIADALDPRDPRPDADCDLVVVAVPVDAAPALLDRLAGSLPPGPAVTDVGSVKRGVMDAARAAGLVRRFVGGHPMAGSHASGWASSRAGLFSGARVWLCPGDAEVEAVTRVGRLWRAVGAVPDIVDAAEHDREMAWASHLPQAAASALAAVLREAGIPGSALGPGGRDMTRLAASDPGLWAGIARANADELGPALRALAARLEGLAALLSRDGTDARRWFEGR